MRTKDGHHNRNRPKRISPLAQDSGKRFGQTDRPPHEVIQLLEKFAPGRHNVPALN